MDENGLHNYHYHIIMQGRYQNAVRIAARTTDRHQNASRGVANM
jgi:hypothetical protein